MAALVAHGSLAATDAAGGHGHNSPRHFSALQRPSSPGACFTRTAQPASPARSMRSAHRTCGGWSPATAVCVAAVCCVLAWPRWLSPGLLARRRARFWASVMSTSMGRPAWPGGDSWCRGSLRCGMQGSPTIGCPAGTTRWRARCMIAGKDVKPHRTGWNHPAATLVASGGAWVVSGGETARLGGEPRGGPSRIPAGTSRARPTPASLAPRFGLGVPEVGDLFDGVVVPGGPRATGGTEAADGSGGGRH